MRIHRFAITLAVAAALLVPLSAQSPDVDLQRAIQKETVSGDLKAAIAEYRKIVDRAGSNRAVAAKALVHIAECYQKMGDAKARETYELVVAEYADQKEAVATARARLGGSTAAHSAGIITLQVWSGPKVNNLGKVSPDGRLLSFTDWSTNDLAVHDLTTGEDRRLTNNTRTSNEYPEFSAISRDGKVIAYAWFNKERFYELRLIDVNGSDKPRSLFANRDIEWIAPYDWSPDGKWLAVELTRLDRTTQIGLVSTADGALRVLKSVDWRGALKIAFSPDGKYLAYDLPASDDSEQRDIYVMASDGSRETPVVVHPANDRVLGWAPDGKHLLFASDRGGSSGVWVLAMADGKSQSEPKLIKSDINPNPLGLTRSGALCYGAGGAGKDVYAASVDFETGKVLSPPIAMVQNYVGFNDSPAWSPDGKYLAYQSSYRDTRGPVFAIRSSETGKVHELKRSLDSAGGGLLWSPESDFLVTHGTDRKGRSGIFRIDAQSGEATPLIIEEPGKGRLTVTGWSRDRKMLYMTQLGSPVMVVHDMQSGQDHEIAPEKSVNLPTPNGEGKAVASQFRPGDFPGGGPTGPLRAPDGQSQIQPMFDPASRSWSLFLKPIGKGIVIEPGKPLPDGVKELARLSDPERFGPMMWSPDGRFVVFEKIFQGGRSQPELWSIPVEGGTPRKIELTGVVVGSLTIHPDGHQVAFAMGARSWEVWMMDNFLPTLRASK